jgi:hypothetical protein
LSRFDDAESADVSYLVFNEIKSKIRVEIMGQERVAKSKIRVEIMRQERVAEFMMILSKYSPATGDPRKCAGSKLEPNSFRMCVTNKRVKRENRSRNTEMCFRNWYIKLHS